MSVSNDLLKFFDESNVDLFKDKLDSTLDKMSYDDLSSFLLRLLGKITLEKVTEQFNFVKLVFERIKQASLLGVAKFSQELINSEDPKYKELLNNTKFCGLLHENLMILKCNKFNWDDKMTTEGKNAFHYLLITVSEKSGKINDIQSYIGVITNNFERDFDFYLYDEFFGCPRLGFLSYLFKYNTKAEYLPFLQAMLYILDHAVFPLEDLDGLLMSICVSIICCPVYIVHSEKYNIQKVLMNYCVPQVQCSEIIKTICVRSLKDSATVKAEMESIKKCIFTYMSKKKTKFVSTIAENLREELFNKLYQNFIEYQMFYNCRYFFQFISRKRLVNILGVSEERVDVLFDDFNTGEPLFRRYKDSNGVDFFECIQDEEKIKDEIIEDFDKDIDEILKLIDKH